MTYTISKDFPFSAAHVLAGLDPGHPCGRLHGHNFVLRVILDGDGLDDIGFVLDYGVLGPVKDWIDDTLDHRNLVDVLGPLNPTSENLAAYAHGIVLGLVPAIGARGLGLAVGVSETPKTWAWYRT